MVKEDSKMSKKTKRSKKEFFDNNVDESPPKKTKVDVLNKFQEEYGSLLNEKLGVTLPKDFFSFFEFIQDMLSDLAVVGLHLTGPYDFLLGNLKKDTSLKTTDLLMHGRHYFDIPEVLTVLHADDKSGFHIGYFRDDPKTQPDLLVSNSSSMNGEFSICGDNIFASVHIFCQGLLKSKDAKKLLKAKEFCNLLEERAKELGYGMESVPKSVKERSKTVNSKTFNKIGIVVPMDKTGVGYRELPNTDRELKQILTRISRADTEEKKNNSLDELDAIITLVQFANDECDYGMGLELGLDLFAFGCDSLRGPLNHLLPLAYQLLGRNLYADVITEHLQNRKREGFISKVNL